MQNTKKWMAVAGVSLAVLALTALALPAAADTAVAAPVQHRGGIGGVTSEYLAEALGVSADELEAAQQAAYQAAIDQALADGLITQEQADAIEERASATGRHSGRLLHSLAGLSGATIDMNALLADALGISADELEAARTEAQELALTAAVEAGRITQEQADQWRARQALRTYLDEQGFDSQAQALYETLVQQAVEAGVITQEQADAILSGSFGGMRGFGGHRGMRGFGGGSGRFSPPSTDSASPSGISLPSGMFGTSL